MRVLPPSAPPPLGCAGYQHCFQVDTYTNDGYYCGNPPHSSGCGAAYDSASAQADCEDMYMNAPDCSYLRPPGVPPSPEPRPPPGRPPSLPGPSPPPSPLPPHTPLPPAQPAWQAYAGERRYRFPQPTMGLPGSLAAVGPADCSLPNRMGCAGTPRIVPDRPGPTANPGALATPNCSDAATGCVRLPVHERPAAMASKPSVNMWTQPAADDFTRLTEWTCTQALELADLDNDGDLDLIVANSPFARTDDDMYTGIECFAYTSEWVQWGTTTPCVDVGAGGCEPMTFRPAYENFVLLNDGQGRFSNRSLFALGTKRCDTTSLAVADLNNDGWLDVLVGNRAPRPMKHADDSLSEPGVYHDADCTNEIHINDRDGGFTILQGPFSERALNTTTIVVGDLDGDGDLDVIVGTTFGLCGHSQTHSSCDEGAAYSFTTATDAVYQNDGSGSLSLVESTPITLGGFDTHQTHHTHRTHRTHHTHRTPHSSHSSHSSPPSHSAVLTLRPLRWLISTATAGLTWPWAMGPSSRPGEKVVHA